MIYFGLSGIGQSYKDRYPFDVRLTESSRLKMQYPDRVPVIIEFDKVIHKNIKKERFLVPTDLTMGQFMFVIRNQLRLEPAEAIFFICRNTQLPNTYIFSEIHEKYAEKCGHVFMRVYKENTFG